MSDFFYDPQKELESLYDILVIKEKYDKHVDRQRVDVFSMFLTKKF